jgi:hypothetical protein
MSGSTKENTMQLRSKCRAVNMIDHKKIYKIRTRVGQLRHLAGLNVRILKELGDCKIDSSTEASL